MVDYRGPGWLKNVCLRNGIELFDRVTAIKVDSLSAEEAGISQQTISQLRRLEKIEFSSGTNVAQRDATVTTLKKSIPDCRLAELHRSEAVVDGVSHPLEVVATLNALSCSSVSAVSPN